MEILQIIVVSLFFMCCAVLIFLIMIQSGKGGGLGMFGGGSSSTAFGSSTVDVVTKATWYGATLFFSLAILAAVAFADSGPKLPNTLPTSNEPDRNNMGNRTDSKNTGEKSGKGMPTPRNGTKPGNTRP